MEPRKPLLALSLVLAVALVVLFYKSVTQDAPPSREIELAEAARRAAREAGKGVSRSGPMGSMLEAMSQARSGIVPADGVPAESFETGRVGTSAPGAAIDCRTQDCSGFAPAGQAGGSEEDERRRLELIAIRERQGGESRFYGEKRAGAGVKTFTPQRYAMPDESAVAEAFGSFLKRLKGAAPAAGGEKGEGSAQGYYEAEEGRAASGGEAPILSAGKLDAKQTTPTLDMLQKLNRDAAQSVKMSGDPAFEDGSRDKSGNKFDGNNGNFGTIPIEEAGGAFGRKVIRKVDPEPEGKGDGRLPDFK